MKHTTFLLIACALLIILGAVTFAGCGGGGGNPPPVSDFVFRTDPASAYTRVDRMAMPGVATAVITSKDDYNAADPQDDEDGDFLLEIQTNINTLQTVLSDDLDGAGLEKADVDEALAQAGPHIIPDTIKVDPDNPAGFPNGRLLEDPVMDLTLALILLDLGVGGETVTTFANIPLNPPANDVATSTVFPHLAGPALP